jgi:hypothetical protein
LTHDEIAGDKKRRGANCGFRRGRRHEQARPVRPANPRQANAKEVSEKEKKKRKLFADAFRAVPEGRSRNENVFIRLAYGVTRRAAQHFESVGVLPGQSRRTKGVRNEEEKEIRERERGQCHPLSSRRASFVS